MQTKKIANKKQSQEKVGFGTAISNFWTKYVDFNGTAQRREFWFAWLFLMLILIPLLVFMFMSLSSENGLMGGFWTLTLFFVEAIVFIPMYSLLSRRCHDAGIPGGIAVVMMVVALFSLMLGLTTLSIEEDAPAIAQSIDGILNVVDRLNGLLYLVIGCLPSKLENNPYRK